MKIAISKGYAYQEDRSSPVVYADEYYNKLLSYEDTDIEILITKHRVGLVEKYCKTTSVLDIGCGTGRFIKACAPLRVTMYGYDVMPKTVKMLKDKHIFIDPTIHIPDHIGAVCFWDSLEHMPDPGKVIDNIPKDCYVFISIPIFGDLSAITKSKHYRPNEHFWYFTCGGLVGFMKDRGLDWVSTTDGEIQAGRDSIYSFVFRKK